MTTAIQPEITVEIEPLAARYLVESRSLEIEFNVGAVYRWPVDALEMRSYTSKGWVDAPRPTDEQLMNVEIWPHKEVVEFVDIEQCFEIAQLMRGQLGSKKWMEKLLNQRQSQNENRK